MSAISQEAKNFPTGKLGTTIGVNEKMLEMPSFQDFVRKSMFRHMNSDWGEIHPEDEGLNEQSLKDGTRLISLYKFKEENGETITIWIITAADRSCTTVMFPNEY